MNKEEIFDIIDEYFKLKHERYTITVIGDKANKDKAFEILLNSDDTFHGMKDSQYSINGVQKRRMDKAKIKYMEV